MRILVFCGHRFGTDPHFISAMHGVGQVIGERKWTLIYGGSDEGLMGVVATAVISHGGNVIGVIPSLLELKGEKPLEALRHPPHQLIITRSMPERKRKMFDLADAIVTGPGGPGMRDEFWEAVTDVDVGVGENKLPHVAFNVNGALDNLERDFDKSIEDGFTNPVLKPPFVSTVDDVFLTIDRIRSSIGQNVVTLPTLSARTAG